jgi:hypothetical protein
MQLSLNPNFVRWLSAHRTVRFLDRPVMLSWLKLHRWSNTQTPAQSPGAHAEPDQNALAYLVPRKFESLEVWLLLFCGVYGLMVTALVLKGARDTMLACVALIGMAIWRRYHPARNQMQWAIGAAVALTVVAWIYADPRSGGSTGPFLYLLILMAIGYPLLMDTPVLLVFMLALLALYFVSGSGKAAPVQQELFLLRGAMIAGMCGIAGRFGMVLRQAEQGIDNLRRDKASLAYNEHGLARYGARMLQSCAAEMQPCTLVLLPLPSDWHDAIDVSGYGSDYSAKHSLTLQNRALRDMALHLTLTLPAEAIVSRNANGDWVVLVPWLERPAVLNMLESRFGRPMQVPFGPRADEMFVPLTPCAVVSSGSDDSLEKMVARAQDIWLRGVRTGVVDAS